MSPLDVLKIIHENAFKTTMGNVGLKQADFDLVTQALSQKPDYAYNPNDWEATYTSDQFAELNDDLNVRFGDVRELATLIEGPRMFAAIKVTAWDDAGDPESYETEWFHSKEEADAAVATQHKRTD